MSTESLGSAPVSPDTQKAKERLIDNGTTGTQAMLLLGIDIPQPGETITIDAQALPHATTEISDAQKEKINNSYQQERQTIWEAWDAKHGKTTHQERLLIWEQSCNKLLSDYVNTDPQQDSDREFLKKLIPPKDGEEEDNLDRITAKRVYETFMRGEHAGDVTYFSQRIIETCNGEEIHEADALIYRLGKKLYGENSGKIAQLIAQGLKNVEENKDEFVQSAQTNITNNNYDRPLLLSLTEQDRLWREKQNTQKPDQQSNSKPDESDTQFPATENHAEFHFMVSEVGSAYIPYRDQDASFSNPQQGVFGVFDGVGGTVYGYDASEIASEDLASSLSVESLSLEDVKNNVYESLLQATQAIRKKMHERLDQRKKDVVRNITGEISDDQLEELYQDANLGDINKIKAVRDRMREEKRTIITDDDEDALWEGISMKTTAVVSKLYEEDGEKKALIGSVGDSRAYLYRDGKLTTITLDDSNRYLKLMQYLGREEAKRIQDELGQGKKAKEITIVLDQSNEDHRRLLENLNEEINFRIQAGYVESHTLYKFNQDGKLTISNDDIRFNTQITQTLGMQRDSLRPTLHRVPLVEGDILMLATDGVFGWGATNPNMATLLAENADLNIAAKKLAELGGNRDDATVELVKIK